MHPRDGMGRSLTDLNLGLQGEQQGFRHVRHHLLPATGHLNWKLGSRTELGFRLRHSDRGHKFSGRVLTTLPNTQSFLKQVYSFMFIYLKGRPTNFSFTIQNASESNTTTLFYILYLFWKGKTLWCSWLRSHLENLILILEYQGSSPASASDPVSC